MPKKILSGKVYKPGDPIAPNDYGMYAKVTQGQYAGCIVYVDDNDGAGSALVLLGRTPLDCSLPYEWLCIPTADEVDSAVRATSDPASSDAPAAPAPDEEIDEASGYNPGDPIQFGDYDLIVKVVDGPYAGRIGYLDDESEGGSACVYFKTDPEVCHYISYRALRAVTAEERKAYDAQGIMQDVLGALQQRAQQRIKDEAMRALLLAASPQPWTHDTEYNKLQSAVDSTVCGPLDDMSTEDCALVVAAVNALPELLAECETMRRRIADLRHAIKTANAMVDRSIG